MEKIFTNTYNTGSGRKNYLSIDKLEDPLFTSFTFDIDFITSPLFYTISGGDYGYPIVEGLGEKIEDKLDNMYKDLSDGYDILPQMSAGILDGNKLGFGIQQNVYMDKPLYGATEYIYMVDKRNGAASQNDSLYDTDKTKNVITNLNTNHSIGSDVNSFKLGSSLKNIVNDADKSFMEMKKKDLDAIITESANIAKDKEGEHEKNKSEFENCKKDYDDNNKRKVMILSEGEKEKMLDEDGIVKEMEFYKKSINDLEQLKKDIADWVNIDLLKIRNQVNDIYNNNDCAKDLFELDYLLNTDENKKKLEEKINQKYLGKYTYYFIEGDESFIKKLKKLYDTCDNTITGGKYKLIVSNGVLKCSCGENSDDLYVAQESTLAKFRDRMKNVIEGDYERNGKVINMISYIGNIYLSNDETLIPNWLLKMKLFKSLYNDATYNTVCDYFTKICSLKCYPSVAFNVEGEEIVFVNLERDKREIEYLERELNNLRKTIYGSDLDIVCDKNNARPDSIYRKYLDAKERYENDEYSQAKKAETLAKSGRSEFENAKKIYENMRSEPKNIDKVLGENGLEKLSLDRHRSVVASQTVLDMLGFISGMRKMVQKYPYIIQGVTGLDVAYNKHYGIKDPYLGSGDDKITLTCLESLDLRVSSMFNRYFNAIYDRQYRRERVPVNLRRFNCTIYVHDVRNFVSILRSNESVYNKVLELTDMYYSVIEFRFYDCEIVPEETGNIFGNISNEAPSEMTKTNFTFTYGNCVVNFVPPSESANITIDKNEWFLFK